MPILLLASLLPLAARGAEADERSALRAALAAYNQGATYDLPAVDAAQEQALLARQVVKDLDPVGGTWRASGMLIIDQPRDAVWLACQDMHAVSDERATEKRLAFDSSNGRATWYGYLDLPAPFDDRHWAVDVWNNHALAAATGGQAWEHPWKINPRGPELIAPLVAQGQVGELTPEMLAEAVSVPVNQGSWAVIVLDADTTLLGYQATIDVGGSIPDRLVGEFSLQGMEKLLRGVEKRAKTWIRGHYVGGHPPTFGGDGRPMKTY